MNRACNTLLLLALTAVAGHAAEPLSPQRQREILQEAVQAYDEAVELGRRDAAAAAARYRAAAAGFEALVDSGVRSFALEYNLGNAYFRLDDLGRAILHYRRAQRLAPGDPRLTANLRYARDRVEPQIVPGGQARLTRQLLFWHYGTSAQQRFWAMLVISGAGWILLAVWLLRRTRVVLGLGLAAVILGWTAGLSILCEHFDTASAPSAVVVARDVPLRLGRGEGSDLALKQPLGPGLELRILQQRGDWVEVRLANDQTGWLPAAAVARV